MFSTTNMKRATIGTALAAALAAGLGAAAPGRAYAQTMAAKPGSDVMLAVGAGRMVRLDAPMSDIFVANDGIADVQVRSSNQLYIFGKAQGETTVYATNKAGKVVYSANVRVGNNIDSVDTLLRLAMPEAQIQSTTMNGMVLLTGTVAAPADVEEATRIVQAYVGEEVKIISRLKTATPQQVMLKVTFAEVSRSLVRQIGVNLLTRDQTGGFLFGIGRGNPGTITDQPIGDLVDDITGEPITRTLYSFNNKAGTTTLGLAGRLLGVDVLSTIDLNENSGLVTILAEPTLTALSGETASFLAGGEFPIATSNGLSGTSIEFKQYGVSLAFSPVVLESGRIAMRVRPEVSELTSDGAITLNNFEIPALTTRRTETTVELGSGQSMMLAGLLRNNGNNSVEKTPVLGDVPILGSLFRSSSFRRNETELVIIVTPYLVKPVSAGQIALPTDGFRLPNEAGRLLLDERHDGVTGGERPGPVMAPAQTVMPGMSAPAAAALPQPAPKGAAQAQRSAARTASASPGFSF